MVPSFLLPVVVPLPQKAADARLASTLASSMKMGKALKNARTPRQSRPQGRKGPTGEADEASTTGEAVKSVRHTIHKGLRGSGKRAVAIEGKTGQQRRTRSGCAASPEPDEGSKSLKGLNDSKATEDIGTQRSAKCGNTGSRAVAGRANRKRSFPATSMPQQKKPGELSRRDRKERDKRGVIYIGHLPVGFLEPQLKAFFSQFGEVCRVRLFRSRKNAHSKGYAFVEFTLREVAEIAAQAMDKYRMFGRTLVCRLMDKGQVQEHVFSKCHKPFKRISWQSRAAAQHNKPDDQRPSAKGISRIDKRMRKKSRLLQDIGIDVEVPAVHEVDGEAGHLSEWVNHESQAKRNAKRAKLEVKRKARVAASAPA